MALPKLLKTTLLFLNPINSLHAPDLAMPPPTQERIDENRLRHKLQALSPKWFFIEVTY